MKPVMPDLIRHPPALRYVGLRRWTPDQVRGDVSRASYQRSASLTRRRAKWVSIALFMPSAIWFRPSADWM
ncbi:MAG: hypothetical protein QOG84_2399 [Sphingomonadales bacterium]|nr:hypothetical protein [Sphingomonadales bacterium]